MRDHQADARPLGSDGQSSDLQRPRLPHLTRRQALQAGVVTAGSLAVEAGRAKADPLSFGLEDPRSEVSFDEDWSFSLGDPAGAQAPSFDDSTWRVLDLPHDWSIEDLSYATSTDGAATADPSAFDYTTGVGGAVGSTTPAPPTVIGPFDEQNSAGGAKTGYTVGGVGWYRKHFELPRSQPWHSGRLHSPEQHVEIRFDGIYEDVDVYINGQHLGFHANGYTPIVYDLTPYLSSDGRNVLAVRVNNSGVNSRWYAGSGIYRHTWLTTTGAVRIPAYGVYVTTPTVSAHQSVAHAEVQVANLGTSAAQAQVLVTVLDPHGRPVGGRRAATQSVAAGATETFSVDVPVARASLWSPDSPVLYEVLAEVVVGGRPVDSTTTPFGIRSLEWNGTVGFQLNGQTIKIRGANLHSTYGPMGAVALARSSEREIEVLQAAGFNAIRTAHNPPAPEVLDACDRLGMLVWDEFSDMWDAAKNPDDYHLYFPQDWPQDLTSMIVRDRNHPSVVIWSLGNEINDTTGGQRGAQMASLVHSLDQSRPVSQGATPFATITDPMYQYVDVADVHYDMAVLDKNALHADYPTKAVTQSESWPATMYDDYQLAVANPWFVGSWSWVGWDYIGESASGAPIYGPAGTPDASLPPFGTATYPWFQDFQGDIDLIGQRKPQNYWRSVIYGLSAIEMLVERPAPDGAEQYAHYWSYYDELPSWTWDVPDGQLMTVHVYTTGDTVTLSFNGTVIATNTVTAADKQVSTFSVPYAAGQLTATASQNGQQIGSQTLTTTGQPAALRLSPDVQSLTTDRDALAHVVVSVVDGQGNRVPDAVVGVSFSLSGAGELVAVGNGNPHNLDSFKRPGRYTWHGVALAIIRPAKQPGRVTLTASAPGLQPATLSLYVGPDGQVPWTRRQALSRRSRGPSRSRSLHGGTIAGFSGAPVLVIGAAVALMRRRLSQRIQPKNSSDSDGAR